MSDLFLRRLVFASLCANVLIVVTGGLVRLTSSGLGCPTWPRCTDHSYVTTPAMGVHGLIEFGNRSFSGLIGLIVLAVVWRAWRYRSSYPRLMGYALANVGVVVAQALLGGATVLTGLNPWLVSCHFLLSLVALSVGYRLWRLTVEPVVSQAGHLGGGPVAPLLGWLRPLRWLLVAASAVVLMVGTLVTGSGPHSGEPGTPRMGFDVAMIAQVHADVVALLVAVSVSLYVLLRLSGARRRLQRAAAVLIAVELLQGVIGVVQYATHLPSFVVAAHLAGACAVWLATLDTAYRLRDAGVEVAVSGAPGMRRPSSTLEGVARR